MRRGAHQRAQLRAQDLGLREAEPQAAKPARPRSAAARPAPSRMPLVEIERADGDAPRRHLLEHAAVGRVLRVLGRRVERPAGQQELRAVEADALRARLVQDWQVLEQLDVGVEPDGARRRPSAAASRTAPATLPRRRGRAARRCAIFELWSFGGR